MRVDELFDIKYGINLELINCEITTQNDPEGVAFVARTSENNGIVAYVKKIEGKTPQPAGVITCAAGGSVLSTFLQVRPFYSGRDLYVLYPQKNMTLNEKLFYCMCIQKNAYRYSYGRQANKSLKDIEIPDVLPIWVNKTRVRKPKSKIKTSTAKIDTTTWKSFRLSDLFDVSTSNDSNLQNSNLGKTPYVASSSENNGITAHIDAVPSQKANTMTIARNGSVGSVFYHAYPYCASPDDVRILSPKFELNKYNALFLKTVIEKEKYKYAYGRKLGTKRIMQMIINLPVDNDGNVDFAYMESFIRSLPNSDCI